MEDPVPQVASTWLDETSWFILQVSETWTAIKFTRKSVFFFKELDASPYAFKEYFANIKKYNKWNI